MLCISHIHPPFQNLLKMYTYISKKTGHLTQISFSVTLARDKERIQETIFKIFTLNVGQTLLAKKVFWALLLCF